MTNGKRLLIGHVNAYITGLRGELAEHEADMARAEVLINSAHRLISSASGQIEALTRSMMMAKNCTETLVRLK